MRSYLYILIRSKSLPTKTNLTLEEYDHKFEFALKRSFKKYDAANTTVVQFSFSKAIDHFLGSNLFSILKFINLPIYVNQCFFWTLRKIELCLDTEKMHLRQKTRLKAGDSSHYCNLKIDQVDVNIFLKAISSNIYGVSMPFVKQKKPGPRANDIIEKVFSLKF